MTKKPITDPRLLAVMCMDLVIHENLLVPEAMARLDFKMEEEDRNLAHELVYGAFRFMPGLEHLLNSLCKAKKLPHHVRRILLLSLYQLRFTRIPDYAVLDTANKLTVRLKFPGLRRLVNGVLRSAQKEGDRLWAELEPAETILPEWLRNLLTEAYGAETLNSWLNDWQKRSVLSYWCIDDNAPEGDERAEYLPHAFRRTRALPRWMLKKRRAYVQNESSQAVAEMVLRLKPETVLDVCSAPGGKCCYLAAFGNLKSLTACDAAPERLMLVEQNRDRLGLSFETKRGDARALDLPEEAYDVVLVDAPCSGVGIIGRHPEIKLLKTGPADQNLRQTQAEIAKAAWRHVKPGGYLLYAVCSLDPAEIPRAPEDAADATQALEQILKDLPSRHRESGFYFPPSAVLDGFGGALWQKRRAETTTSEIVL
ncbi:MAG: transcription antitermination factor NusB [Acidobacteriota bacterium]|nr:transcription antitermination factor NusB [Acidobacteriota bacterium]